MNQTPFAYRHALRVASRPGATVRAGAAPDAHASRRFAMKTFGMDPGGDGD